MRETGRLELLDAIRGLAALAVVLFHFVTLSPLYGAIARVTPRPLLLLIRNGDLGVAAFFTLSGFVIAHSLRTTDSTPRSLGTFMGRRMIRLGPPYWCAIALLALLQASRPLLGLPGDAPSLGVLLAHATYMHGILGIPSLTAQFWTLPVEVQFYAAFCVSLLAERMLRARGVRPSTAMLLVQGALGTASLCWFAAGLEPRGWFVHYWYSFALGVLACWALQGRIHAGWWIALAVAACALALPQRAGFTFVAAATGALILVAGRAGRLHAAANPVLKWLSAVSYSLYLTHFVGWAACNLLGGRVARSPAGAVAFLAGAVAMSLVVAEIFRRVVENPSLELSRRKRRAGTIAGA